MLGGGFPRAHYTQHHDNGIGKLGTGTLQTTRCAIRTIPPLLLSYAVYVMALVCSCTTLFESQSYLCMCPLLKRKKVQRSRPSFCLQPAVMTANQPRVSRFNFHALSISSSRSLSAACCDAVCCDAVCCLLSAVCCLLSAVCLL